MKLILSLHRVYGRSMEPTLYGSQYVVASPLPYRVGVPRVGDIVVAQHPTDTRTIIKRIGKIKRRRYYLVGDNLGESTDSRRFGSVDRQNIIAKVILS